MISSFVDLITYVILRFLNAEIIPIPADVIAVLLINFLRFMLKCFFKHSMSVKYPPA